MTPRGRLRKAVKLLDEIDKWNDRTDKLPTFVLDTLHEAQGLVAVTIHDLNAPIESVPSEKARREEQ